jgi:hypothetical protein
MGCSLVAGLAAAPAAAQTSWSYPSGQANWIANDVSLGNRGTQIFAELGPAYSARLLSSFDQSPPAPIWETSADLAFNHSVASAETRDLHVSLRHENDPTYAGLRNGWLRVFTSASPDPIWSAKVSTRIAGHDLSDVFVTPDGSQIVTAVFDTGSFNLDLEFYRPESSLPFRTMELPIGGASYAMELSDDASLLYVATTSDSKVYDLTTGTRLAWEFVQTQVYGGHGFAGDGSYFAMGGSGNVRVFRRQPNGTYSLDFTHTVPVNGYCNAIAISSDGSTMAVGFNVRDGFRTAIVQAIDLETRAVLMSESVVGNGQLQNLVNDLDISDDGSRIAAALTGDGASVHELRVYNSNSSTPIRTADLSGSALVVDLSADGAHLAVGCKAAHSAQFGSGGCIEYLELDQSDFTVLTVPRAGASLDLEVRAAPNSTVMLFSSDDAAGQPIFYPSLGTLYLRRAITMSTLLGTTNSQGVLRARVSLSRHAVGTNLHLQGFLLPKQELTDNWAKVTVLP